MGKGDEIKKRRFRYKVFTYILLIFALISFLNSCKNNEQKLNITTEYKAVFLDNGQVFFGRLEEMGPSYALLKDVFYVQSQVNQETRQVTNILVKRGKEWHSPDMMYINASKIVVIEPVSPDSRVSQLIREAKGASPLVK